MFTAPRMFQEIEYYDNGFSEASRLDEASKELLLQLFDAARPIAPDENGHKKRFYFMLPKGTFEEYKALHSDRDENTLKEWFDKESDGWFDCTLVRQQFDWDDAPFYGVYINSFYVLGLNDRNEVEWPDTDATEFIQELIRIVNDVVQQLRDGTYNDWIRANLPYQITSPVLLKLLDVKEIDVITVMIQREVAERICASPGTADYGAFSLRVQWDMKPEILFTVPPSCFMPQPGVTSAVIRMTRRDKPPDSVRDGKAMFRLIRAAFGQRRKTLANAVSSQLPGLDRAAVEQALLACGLDMRIRGENLTIEQFAQLSDELF